MNYLLSFAICVSLTIFPTLGDSLSAKYLTPSDINVAASLIIAWGLDKKRKAIDINLTVRKGD